jgi:hypothetical protein
VRRTSMLSSLKDFFSLPAKYVFAGGDWNLTEHASDSSSSDHFASIPTQRKALSETLEHFKLREVYQSCHTRFQNEQSSRLDRIYVSHSISDQCLISPEVTLPPHPYQAGGRYHHSDHLPILLSFSDTSLQGGARFKIPEWLANSNVFLQRVRHEIGKAQKIRHPVKAWLQLKRIITNTARRLMLSYRKHAENRAHALTLGIGVLRKARKNTSDSLGATSLAERDPELLLAYEADVSSHSTTFPKAC